MSVRILVDSTRAAATLGLLLCAVDVQSGNECELVETDQLTAPDAAAGDLFGSSIAISGDTAIIGSVFNDGPDGSSQGSAYILVREGSTWLPQATFTPSDAGNGYFGYSVAIDGDTAIVGAALAEGPASPTQGAAYIFVRAKGIWTQQAKLTASDGAGAPFFGRSVGIAGDTVIVGAEYQDGPAGTDQGAAYVFVRNGTTWSQQTKLTAFDAEAQDFFGDSVTLAGNTAIVGAPYHGLGNRGTAYVFVRTGTTWTWQAQLNASDASTGDIFGTSAAISGNTAIIGAPTGGSPTGQPHFGSAYAFVRNGTLWTQQAILTASGAYSADSFGLSVGISGDSAIVSRRGTGITFSRTGSTWIERQTLQVSSDPAALDTAFGTQVAITDEAAIIATAGFDGKAGLNQGAAFPFECAPAVGDLNGDGVVDTLDLGILLSGWSIPITAPGCGGMVPCPADINGDGFVNTIDLGILLSAWTL